MQFIFILFFLLQIFVSPHSFSPIISSSYAMDLIEKEDKQDEVNINGNNESKVSKSCTNHKIREKRPFLSFSLSELSLEKITNLLNELDEKLKIQQIMPPIGVKGVTNLHSTISMSKFPFMTVGVDTEESEDKELSPEIADKIIHFLESNQKDISLKNDDEESIDKFLPLFSKYNMLQILKAQSTTPKDFHECQLDYANYYYYKLLKILLKKTQQPFNMTFIPTTLEALGKQNRFITIRGKYTSSEIGLDNFAEFLNINSTPHISITKYDNNVQAKIENVILSTYFQKELLPLINKYFIAANSLAKLDSEGVRIYENIKDNLFNLDKLGDISTVIQENFKLTLLRTLDQVLTEWRESLKMAGKESFYDSLIQELMITAKVKDISNPEELEKFLKSLNQNWMNAPGKISADIIDKLWEKYKGKDDKHGEIIDSFTPEYSIKEIFKKRRSLINDLFQFKKSIKNIADKYPIIENKYPEDVQDAIIYIRNQKVGEFYTNYKDMDPKDLLKKMIHIFPNIEGSSYDEILNLLKNHKILSSIQSQMPEIRNYQALETAAKAWDNALNDFFKNITTIRGDFKCTAIKSNFNDFLKDLNDGNLEDFSNTIKSCAIVSFLDTQFNVNDKRLSRIKSYLRKQNPQLKFDNIDTDLEISSPEALIGALLNPDNQEPAVHLRKIESILKSYKNIINSKGVTSIDNELKTKLIQKFDLNEKRMLKLIKYVESRIVKALIRDNALTPQDPAFNISEMSKELVIDDMDEESFDDRFYVSKLIVRNLMRLYDALLNATGNPNKVMSYGDYIQVMGAFIKEHLKSQETSKKSALDEIELTYKN